MQSTATDPTWALFTLLVTAIVGTSIGLVLIVLVSSRHISKPAKRIGSAIGIACFLAWLFTIGDPGSSVSFENLYYKSVNMLPDNSVGRYLKHNKRTVADTNKVTNTASSSTSVAGGQKP